MTLIQVNYASLDDGALTLGALNGRLNQLITDLETAMKPVLTTWDGEAMTTYTQRKAEWDTATNELTGLVAQFGKAVDEANQHHQATERKIVNSLS